MVYFVYIVSFIILFISCTEVSSQQQNNAELQTSATTDDSVSVRELPLPAVPTSLREPSLRANYIIEHFWDEMDFSDTQLSCDAVFMEQNFSNFISVFPIATGESCRLAVSTLLHKAEADSAAYVLLTDIAEKYLYDPNSPMYDEGTYLLFLEQVLSSPALDYARVTRLGRQRQFASLNRPGMRAADFSYVTRQGKRSSLYKTSVKDKLLLLFYDPDCDHCREVLSFLCSSSLLSDNVDSGRISVLAIYAEEDRELWDATKSELPSSWTVGMDTSGDIYNKGLYSLRALPAMYLLDANKTVVLKDVSPETLSDYMSNM